MSPGSLRLRLLVGRGSGAHGFQDGAEAPEPPCGAATGVPSGPAPAAPLEPAPELGSSGASLPPAEAPPAEAESAGAAGGGLHRRGSMVSAEAYLPVRAAQP